MLRAERRQPDDPVLEGRVGWGERRIGADMSGFWRRLVSDSQLRWLGPEKGVIHLATAAVVNAVWDLWAKLEGKPLWKLLVDLSPEELVACVDFRYIDDVAAAARTRSSSCATRGAVAQARESRDRAPRATRRTRRRPDGSATTTAKVEALVRAARRGRASPT